jgi:murein DD-endopeptidase MepM/ murein hydrolase activator NlpD
MGELSQNTRVRSVLRLTAAGAAAALLAGCSSDVSRLGSGPFGPADNTPTASIGSRTLTPPEAISGAPAVAAASSGAWGAPSTASSAIQSTPLAPPVASAAHSSAPSPATVASAARTVGGGSFGPWTTAGGTPVTVGAGESASVLAARYGVPMEALVRANGLSSASQVTPGTQLVVPIYNAAARQASGASSGVSAGAAAAVGAAAVGAGAAAVASRTANSAGSTARNAPAPAKAQTARAAETLVKPGQRVASAADATRQTTADAARTAAAAPKRDAAKPAEAAKPRETAQKPKENTQKPRETAQKPAEPERQQTASAPAAAVATGADGKPEFRWPARGRIIQGFKSGANDGIAIAVPEGTAVKAAESGVVAYAGNELKGYGNLVLIRHPNGFVSAYAHNGEINVKRGESVKRGQTIAKSGQTGNVSAPQLHFELRKGSTPVDPTQYLAGL